MYSSAPAPILSSSWNLWLRDGHLDMTGQPARACAAALWTRYLPMRGGARQLAKYQVPGPCWHLAGTLLSMNSTWTCKSLLSSPPTNPPTVCLHASMQPRSPSHTAIVNRFSSWILHSPFARLLLLLLPSHPPHLPLSISSLSSLPPSRPPPAVLFSLVVFQPRSPSLSPSLISIASRILARCDFVPVATFTSVSTSGSESSSGTSPKISDSQSKRRRS